MRAPFIKGQLTQGDQSELTPRMRYRAGLAALDAYCAKSHGRVFADLSDTQQDAILTGLEEEKIRLDGADGKALFEALLNNTMEGFFADPIYGGNRDMVSWKMIGFPGARYDYRDYIRLYNQKLDLAPLSIAGRPGWTRLG